MPKPEPVKPQARSFNCPNCAAPVDLRVPRQTQSVVCGSCGSVLDVRTPEVKILQEYNKKLTHTPIIPLGRRGKLRGEQIECIGYMRRTLTVEGESYTWSEYVLWSPYVGYRWLTEYDGHWSYIKTTNAVAKAPKGSSGTIKAYGMTFKHFQSYTAEVTFVLGEFPWIVRRGSKARCADYVSPPFMLSGEQEEDEYTWSLGEYTSPATIWQAFLLPGNPRTPAGVFANQPSPHAARIGRIWGIFGAFAGANVALAFLGQILAKQPSTSPGCCTIVSLLALAAWPIATQVMASQFETQRWAESDHA
ncbi:MAG: DUF4178 domain-containing protein [Planctomycetota bacterium]